MDIAAGEVGTLRFAKNGEILAANPAAAHLFGFASPDELIAAAGRGHLIDTLPPGALSFAERFTDHPGPTLAEAKCSRSDGSGWTCRMALLPVFAPGGGLIEVEALLLEDVDGRAASDHRVAERTAALCEANRLLTADIAERRRVEQELRESEERLRLLAEEQKRQQEILKEEDRRKNDFLALLGHELRNPLNPIRVAASLLRRAGATDPTLRRAREIIDRQVTQMARLIDDLLDVSRISRGKILLRQARFDLVELVRTTLSDRGESLQGHGLSLDMSLPPSPLFVLADPARIVQVLGNLLDNAEKFTDPGGRITVTIRRDEEGRAVDVAVRDSGIGMSPQTMERVFEPFVQDERSVGRARGGLGLGLSLVRGLVDLHQGSVAASSEGEGRGTCITLRLPLPDQEEEDRVADAPAPSPPRARRILLIEDNPDAAEALGMALFAAGHEVVVASSGEEGVERARAFRPRVVLSDIGLPGMSGYDVARALREDRALASIHLIAISGYGQEEDQRRALAAGFDRHLTKPFDLDALERLIAGLSPEAEGTSPAAAA